MPKINKSLFEKYKFYIFNLIVVGLFLALPYYMFRGRLFLGGDDTRFYINYPKLILSSLSIYSWNNISSLPYYIPNHYWIPFTVINSLLQYVIVSKVVTSYFLFSTVIILGFIYFQKFIKELLGEDGLIPLLSSLIYILSPITLVSLSFFLAPVWLIALVPMISYHYLRYIKNGQRSEIIITVAWSILLSFAYYSIPWILGISLPILLSLVLYVIVIDRSIIKNLKRTVIFALFIVVSQLFWVLPFFFSIVSGGQTSLGQKVFSEDLVQSFSNTVLTTANDNIIYPILNLYHRKLLFDFEWQLKNVYLLFYDKTLILSNVYVLILFLGFSNFNKVLNSSKGKIFIFFAVAFLLSLYFCTINIGFLKQIFVLFVYLPGFAILRNFTDKFAMGYVFIYSSFLAICLLVIKKTTRYYLFILIITLLVVLGNAIPIKQIIVTPLWKTKNIYTIVNIPDEYISFLNNAKSIIP